MAGQGAANPANRQAVSKGASARLDAGHRSNLPSLPTLQEVKDELQEKSSWEILCWIEEQKIARDSRGSMQRCFDYVCGDHRATMSQKEKNAEYKAFHEFNKRNPGFVLACTLLRDKAVHDGGMKLVKNIFTDADRALHNLMEVAEGKKQMSAQQYDANREVLRTAKMLMSGNNGALFARQAEMLLDQAAGPGGFNLIMHTPGENIPRMPVKVVDAHILDD